MYARFPSRCPRRPHGAPPISRRSFAALTLLLFLATGAALPARPAAWKVTATPHFALYVPASMVEAGTMWGGRAEKDYAEVSSALGLSPKGRIPLYLYPRARDFREAAGIKPHDLVVGTSETRGGLIRLDVSGLFSDADRTLRHEITHSVLALGLGPNVDTLPLWFNEGLAQVTGQSDDPAALERARQARGQGTLPKLPDLAAEFPHGDGADEAYAASSSAAAYFVRLFGWDGVRELLGRVREGETFSTAFREASGIELNEFYDSWDQSLVRRGWMEWVGNFYFPVTGLLMIWATWVAYGRVMRRHRRIERDEEPEEPHAPTPHSEPEDELDELDVHSGLRPHDE